MTFGRAFMASIKGKRKWLRKNDDWKPEQDAKPNQMKTKFKSILAKTKSHNCLCKTKEMEKFLN